MAFDWLSFLDSRRIEYSTSGPNVSRGNVAIHCPFCGSADEGQHLSLSTEGRGWRCLRRPGEHKGRSPVHLVQALANCSYEQAAAIVGVSTFIPPDFAAHVRSRLEPPAPEPERKLELPKEFKSFWRFLPSATPFLRYLYDREFILRDAVDFNLYYCKTGDFTGRIIFPIEFEGRLVSWTGRTIFPDVQPRYKVLSTKESIGPISDYLLWYDDLKNSDAEAICLCEGPFDALKVAVLGQEHGITATCFFTMTPSRQQIDLLHDILPRFKKKYLLLDQGTMPVALRIVWGLQALGVEMKALPSGVKDPGELRSVQFLLEGA